MPVPSNPLTLSRWSFLQTAACLILGSVAAGHSLAAVLHESGDVALAVTADDAMASAVPATWALGELEKALVAQGTKVRRIANLSEATANEFCILAAAFESPLCRAFSGSKTLLRRRKRSRFASHKAKSIPAAYTAARFALQ